MSIGDPTCRRCGSPSHVTCDGGASRHTAATPEHMHKIELVAIPTEEWAARDFGRSVWRVRVPGGWLYVIGCGKEWALPPVFVPEPKEAARD